MSVTPTGFDDEGNPTGFAPSTPADAEVLDAIGIDTNSSTGELYTTPVEEVEDVDNAPPLDESGSERLNRKPETGNSELDEVLTGSTATDAGDKGWETPQTVERFEENVRNIPGAIITEHGGPRIHATLPDGTEVSTYPARGSTGHPGFQVVSPDGELTKGSLVGQ